LLKSVFMVVMEWFRNSWEALDISFPPLHHTFVVSSTTSWSVGVFWCFNLVCLCVLLMLFHHKFMV
jgi:hypothetical protein